MDKLISGNVYIRKVGVVLKQGGNIYCDPLIKEKFEVVKLVENGYKVGDI